MLTIAVNLMANFVAPIYVLANLFPRHLNFRRAALVSAVIGLVILPWNLYNNPTVIVYFLGGLGAILGPLFGVIMADYWLIRKSKVNVPDLYTDDDTGDYHYRGGFNLRAIMALIPAAVIAVILALVPFFPPVAGFSWFIGAGSARSSTWSSPTARCRSMTSTANRSLSPASTEPPVFNQFPPARIDPAGFRSQFPNDHQTSSRAAQRVIANVEGELRCAFLWSMSIPPSR